MGKYSVIFWDLDQTLLNFDLSQRCAISRVFRHFGLAVDERMLARYDAINREYWSRLELGEADREEVLLGRFRTFFEEFGIERIDPEEINSRYQEELGSIYFYMDGAKETVLELGRRGYRQYVLTNGSAVAQAGKMKLSGLSEMTDGVFVSETIGFPKPMKAFYDACFRALPGVGRTSCIMVGDSLTSDMRGANNAGIAACWFNPEGRSNDTEVRIDYEIRRLAQLPAILEEEYV